MVTFGERRDVTARAEGSTRRLEALADGFAATLEQLCRTGSARSEPPGVKPSGLIGFKAAIRGKLVDCV